MNESVNPKYRVYFGLALSTDCYLNGIIPIFCVISFYFKPFDGIDKVEIPIEMRNCATQIV